LSFIDINKPKLQNNSIFLILYLKDEFKSNKIGNIFILKIGKYNPIDSSIETHKKRIKKSYCYSLILDL
jgi:hypothetical protein